jgi:hypothetical protein
MKFSQMLASHDEPPDSQNEKRRLEKDDRAMGRWPDRLQSIRHPRDGVNNYRDCGAVGN